MDEVAEDIFRINVAIPGAPVTFSFFVIRDEQPALVETGFRRAFDEAWQAVSRVIDPRELRYVVVPHTGVTEWNPMRETAAPPAGPPG